MLIIKQVSALFVAKQILKVYHFMARRQKIFCKGNNCKVKSSKAFKGKVVPIMA
jgi:hypothetical protein